MTEQRDILLIILVIVAIAAPAVFLVIPGIEGIFTRGSQSI